MVDEEERARQKAGVHGEQGWASGREMSRQQASRPKEKQRTSAPKRAFMCAFCTG